MKQVLLGPRVSGDWQSVVRHLTYIKPTPKRM